MFSEAAAQSAGFARNEAAGRYGGSEFKELLKISWVGAAVVVYKNKVIGGIRIASFLFVLYDMTEMVSLNIKYQNM